MIVMNSNFIMCRSIVIMFLYCLLSVTIYGHETPVCISLGATCSAAAGLSAWGLRKAAYPFDWVISEFGPFMAALRDGLRQYVSGLDPRKVGRGVMNAYGIALVHDFPTVAYHGSDIGAEDHITGGQLSPDWRLYIPAITQKYKRRIDRFYERCQGNGKLFFIRHFGGGKAQAKQIRDFFVEQYPTLDFTLVIVGPTKHFRVPWGIDRIRNYYLNDRDVWNDPQQWRAIFEDLGFLPKMRAMPSLSVVQKRYMSTLCGTCAYCMHHGLLPKQPEQKSINNIDSDTQDAYDAQCKKQSIGKI